MSIPGSTAMCGIAGIVSLDGSPIAPHHLALMSGSIAHRGPDDEGYALVDRRLKTVSLYCGEGSCAAVRARLARFDGAAGLPPSHIGLCHRRFSIIDLSDAAHQPFMDADGRYCMVYNGEIYNYLELRDELRGCGVQFRTSSDTEVLLEAYKHWGSGCFGRLNGFWACAIYDRTSDRLILSRDRIGKKGLYWTAHGGVLYFASEIKALLAIPAIRGSCGMDVPAACLWLAHGKKNIDSSTFFENISLFPQAHTAVADAAMRPERYWSLPAKRHAEKDIAVPEASSRLRELLIDSVRLRLRSDVPVGIELSGGLDSSVIAAACAAAGRGDVAAYTVCYGPGEESEVPFASEAARHLRMPLTVLDVPKSSFWPGIRDFTWLHEEPYHSPVLMANLEMWLAMRAKGVKVSLNGAAGDECFAGYYYYFWGMQLEHALRGRWGRYVRNALGYSEQRGFARNAVYPLLYSAGRVLFDMFPQLRLPYRLKMRGDGPFRHRLLATSRMADEMVRSLMPYWMASGDRDCMGVPLEVRMPFLDYRVVEFAFRLPETYLIRDGWHKWILRKAFEHDLPEAVVWRPKKVGFPYPLAAMLRESGDITAMIVSRSSQPLVGLRRETDLCDWRALSFILWHELFIRNNTALFDAIEKAAAVRSGAREWAFPPGYASAGRARPR